MIDPVQYIIFCHDALIPIGRTEMRGLKKLTDKDGWLDEEKLRKCADMAKEFYEINRIKAARG